MGITDDRLHQVMSFFSCSEEVPTQRAAFPIKLSQQDSFRLPTHSRVTCASVQTELQEKILKPKFRQISWPCHCSWAAHPLSSLLSSLVHPPEAQNSQESQIKQATICLPLQSGDRSLDPWISVLEPAGSLDKLSVRTEENLVFRRVRN